MPLNKTLLIAGCEVPVLSRFFNDNRCGVNILNIHGLVKGAYIWGSLVGDFWLYVGNNEMEMHPTNPQLGLKVKILIVDDDARQRDLLVEFLRRQGFDTVTAESGEKALEVLRREPIGMMISDVRMPGMNGLQTLRRVRAEFGNLPVLLVTAYADVRDAVEAMRDGALSYLTKPIDLDELLSCVQQAMGLGRKPIEYSVEGKLLPPGIIVVSPQMQILLRDAALVAESDCPVLITGESGTGKEVLAQIIHSWSKRAQGPLVKVNCAAIPEALLESELFGHEKGAFTGAVSQRIGRFEEARGGTIFLDEIAEMSPKLQAKLLRVTQDGVFQRVGSNKDIRTDARIIAATNRNLEEEVKAGRFREDLYYRLNVVEFNIPPLRERPEDIIPLATAFLNEFTGGRTRLSSTAVECLRRYHWPGNVRELKNLMQRAALLCRGDVILPEHLPSKISLSMCQQAVSVESTGATSLEELERQTILATLRKFNYNRTETARALGISRRTLVYKLQKMRELGYQVDPPGNYTAQPRVADSL